MKIELIWISNKKYGMIYNLPLGNMLDVGVTWPDNELPPKPPVVLPVRDAFAILLGGCWKFKFAIIYRQKLNANKTRAQLKLDYTNILVHIQRNIEVYIKKCVFYVKYVKVSMCIQIMIVEIYS